MKYKAYQVAPEYQESPLDMFDEMPEELEVYGNKDYERHTSDIFDNVLEALEEEDFDYVNTEGKDIERLNELAAKYYTRGANNEAIIAEALSIVTGEKWEYKCISGCCQSDWNYVYYRPEEWTDKELEYFEIEYFNIGEEWRIMDENGDECYYYTHEWSDIYKTRELAENIGCSVQDLTLYAFDGWTKTPKYKEV